MTVQTSPNTKSFVGSSVYAAVPPVTAAPCEPLEAQAMAYQPSITATSWLKVSVTFELTATLVTPLAGDVDITAGG